jgi:hypothetical protein
MNAVPFDTLKMAQRLEAAGFSGTQAAGASEALAEALLGADLATKADINALRSEMKGELGSLRSEMKGESSSLRAEMRSENALLRGDIELLRRDMTIRLGGMMVVGFGVLAAIMRFVPPHP